MFFNRYFTACFIVIAAVIFNPFLDQMLEADNRLAFDEGSLLASVGDKQMLRQGEGNIAVVLFVKGKAFAEDSDKDRFPLKIKSRLFKGDTIVTDDLSLIQINFLDGSMIRLTGNGRMTLDQYLEKSDGLVDANIDVEEGDFAVMVKKVSKTDDHHNYSVSTKSAKVSFKGTFGQGNVKPGGDLNFVLVPETINGQVVHSQAVVQNIASGKSAMIASDPAAGNNGANISGDTVRLEKIEVDMSQLAEKFGMPITPEGGVDVATAASGEFIGFEEESQDLERADTSEEKEEDKSKEEPVSDEKSADADKAEPLAEEGPMMDADKAEPLAEEGPMMDADKAEPLAEEGPMMDADKAEPVLTADTEDRERRSEARDKVLSRMSERREKEGDRRMQIREKVSSGDIDPEKGLLEEKFFDFSDDESTAKAENFEGDFADSDEKMDQEKVESLGDATPVFEADQAMEPAASMNAPGFDGNSDAMFSGDAGKSIVFESLAMMGFAEDKVEGASYDVDFSDVGFELDEELASSIFIEEEFDSEEGEEGEKGSAFSAVEGVPEGAGEAIDSGATNVTADDSFRGEDGSYLGYLARLYIQKAVGEIDVIPGQEGVDPIGLIVERTQGEFSRYFHDAIARNNLEVPGGTQELFKLESEMWREFRRYFLPYFISSYQDVLREVREKEHFFEVDNPLDEIALIEQEFLKDMSDQADMFSREFFHSAFDYYTEQFERERYVAPEEAAVRGKDTILVGRDYADFPEFNYAGADNRKAISGEIEADANKFVGSYINTREAPGKESIPFIKALGDLSIFQKEAANPFIADDFEELRQAMSGVKEKVEAVDDSVNGDWSKVEKTSLAEIRELVQVTIDKLNMATANIPVSNDEQKQDLESLRNTFLEPMLYRLQEENNLYLGLELSEKEALAVRLARVETDMDAIRGFVDSYVTNHDDVPPEIQFNKQRTIESKVRSLNKNMELLKNGLHPDDPLVERVEDFTVYTELNMLADQLKGIREAGQGDEKVPPELLFESFSAARQLLKMVDQMEGNEVTFQDIQYLLNNNISQVGSLSDNQEEIKVDFFDFFGDDFQNAVKSDGVIDQAIGNLDQGDSFALPEEAILDLDITVFREDVQQVQMLIRDLEKDGFVADSGNKLKFLQLNKSLESLKKRYDFLSNELPTNHPLKTRDLDNADLGKTWDEMGVILLNIQDRLPAYLAQPLLIPPTDSEFVSLTAFLKALDQGVISNLIDESEGKSVLDLSTGGSLRHEAVRPAGIQKGNMVVLNKRDFYEVDGEVKQVREISYLGKEIAEEDKTEITGVKKFNSQFDKYNSLPELMTSMLAYKNNDEDSLTFNTDGVVDFGSDSEKPKGFISFFIPSFGGDKREGNIAQEVPEVGFEGDGTHREVVAAEPVLSPVVFEGYRVKSANVSQSNYAFVEEGDVLMVLERDSVPAGTYLDMRAVLTEENFGVTQEELGEQGFAGFTVEEFLVGNNAEVAKGQQVISLVRSNADKPVETQVIYPEDIPPGYRVKTLGVPQNEALIVEEGVLLLVLEHENPELRSFHKDIEIRAESTGNFKGGDLAVGDVVDPGVKLGDLTGIDNLGKTRILLAAEEGGIFKKSSGLSVGDVLDPGALIGRITVTTDVEFDDVYVRAEKSGVYQGFGLEVGDEVQSMQRLGEFIEGVEDELNVEFLEKGISEETLIFGKNGEAVSMAQDPRAAMVFYFDEETGEKTLYQMKGFKQKEQPHLDGEMLYDESEVVETAIETPLIKNVSDDLVLNNVEFIGETNTLGQTRVDGLAVNGKGVGTDVQLMSTSFSALDDSLLLPGEDENAEIPRTDYYGFANGFLVNVDTLENKIKNWFVSPSKSLYLPLEFDASGSGEFAENGQLELETGVDFNFGTDPSQVNMLVDREHLLTTFSSASGDGLLMSFPVPEFTRSNVFGGITVAKPENAMWGSWDVDAVTGLANTDAVMPGLHNYWAAGTPTTTEQRDEEVSLMQENGLSVTNYQLMVGKTFISKGGLEDDAIVSSEGGRGKLVTDNSDDTWQSMVYFSDGYLLVGKGELDDVAIRSSSGKGVDAHGFNTDNGGWTIVNLLDYDHSVKTELSNPSLVNNTEDSSGIGGMKGFFAGEDMTEVILTASAQADAVGGRSGDGASFIGLGTYESVESSKSVNNFVGFMDGVVLDDDSREVKGDTAFFNLDGFALKAARQGVDPSQLPTDAEELDALLTVNPFIDAGSLSGGSLETIEKHNWVEVRETFRVVKTGLPDSQTISESMINGSNVTIGDTLIAAESGLEILSTMDGTLFFHNGKVPGSSLLSDEAFATVIAYEGDDIIDGMNTGNTRFSQITDGEATKGALTLVTQNNLRNPLGLLEVSDPVYEQGRVIVKTSTPAVKHVPELVVEYRVKVDDMVSEVEKDDRPFYVRLLLTAPDGKEFVVELPKLDVSGMDEDGFVDFLFDSASSSADDVTIYDLAGTEDEVSGNLADFLDESAPDSDLREVLTSGIITEVSLVFGGDIEVEGELHIDSISVKNAGEDDFAIADDFEDLIASPQDLIYLDKDSFYIAPVSIDEAKLYLPTIDGMDPVNGTSFIATLKGLEDFEFLSFGLWKSQYQDSESSELMDASGYFAVGNADHVYTVSDHERYLEALRNFNMPHNMEYSGLSVGSVYGPGRDGRVQIGEARLNINMFSGATSGSINLGPDMIDLQTGSLEELRRAFGGGGLSNGMGFSGSAELIIDGAAASGRTDLGTYQGALFGKYSPNAINAAKEAAGTYKAKNAAGTHRATGAFGVKKD